MELEVYKNKNRIYWTGCYLIDVIIMRSLVGFMRYSDSLFCGKFDVMPIASLKRSDTGFMDRLTVVKDKATLTLQACEIYHHEWFSFWEI
jgi:hypothetical protein